MQQDMHGLVLTTSDNAARAFDHAVLGYVGNRADLADRVRAVLSEDPEFGLGHCLKGYLAVLGFSRAGLEAARTEAAEARRLTAGATGREQAHAAALQIWVEGHADRAAAAWDEILAEHPRDLLAFRLAHFVNFWRGRPDLMLASVESVEGHWSPALPGWGSLLACRCFALEECGRYPDAEAAGRAAIEHDPYDLWAAHGVAHVMEMQGRQSEGIAWIDRLHGYWGEANNLRHHLWWHAALFHLEQGDTDRVLAVYDREIRNPTAKLTRAQPDLYIDVQNAASMLFRLRLRGVDVGDRWEELADKAEARIGDCQSAFTLPHWMMALSAAGRDAAAARLVEAMRAFGEQDGAHAEVVRRYALPVSEAVLAHGRGDFAGAVAVMRPALGGMHLLGGSHAQQDVLEQVYLDAAVKAGLGDDVRRLLERVAGRHPVSPAGRAAYEAAARRYGFG